MGNGHFEVQMVSAPHPASLSDEELRKVSDERHVRRSGPGGQHRNKVESGIVLLHRPTGLTAEANERRSQAENREVAFARLRRRMALEVRTSPGSTPSELWSNRARGGKIRVNPGHSDFPKLLAECLDVLLADDWNAASSAERLGITTSQLVKFLKLEPAALAKLNDERKARALGPLQ